MNELIEISLLLDFYGQLLTERQFEILDLHYNGDYSLGEISEQLNISRQGVYDNIKRGKATLYEFEKKLGLVGRFSAQKTKLESMIKSLDSVDISVLHTPDRNIVEAVKAELNDLAKELS